MKLVCLILFIVYTCSSWAQRTYSIPAQSFDLNKSIGDNRWNAPVPVDSFSITGQVTLGMYKQYLDAVKNDSSLSFYSSQLPDSLRFPPGTFRQYFFSGKYDQYPVAGVSWDDAMSYCKWRTITENRDSIKVIYRLPSYIEWAAAYSHLQSKGEKHDMNRDFSDWTLTAKDESAYEFGGNNIIDYLYMGPLSDPPVMRRKAIIGSSFRYKLPHLYDYYNTSYYAFEGYPHISFRMIVIKRDHQKQVSKKSSMSITEHVLKYWGLKDKKKM